MSFLFSFEGKLKEEDKPHGDKITGLEDGYYILLFTGILFIVFFFNVSYMVKNITFGLWGL